MNGKPLSPERAARLEELRAKYPKYGPAEPVRQTFRKSLGVYLHFEPIATCKEEADKFVYDWMWKHGAEISDLLYDTYKSEGVRNITLVWE